MTSKLVQELVIAALNDEQTNYTCSFGIVQTGHNDLEDVDTYRQITIDDDRFGMRATVTHYKTKKPLDTVDILESLRFNKHLPENNIGKGTLQEAIDYHKFGKEENVLLIPFFSNNRMKDHQIIVWRDHHHKGVMVLFKESRDEFVLANFIDTIA